MVNALEHVSWKKSNELKNLWSKHSETLGVSYCLVQPLFQFIPVSVIWKKYYIETSVSRW